MAGHIGDHLIAILKDEDPKIILNEQQWDKGQRSNVVVVLYKL